MAAAGSSLPRLLLITAALCAPFAAASDAIVDNLSYNPIGRPTSEAVAAWEVFGDASVHPDFLRLTADEQHKRGVVVVREPANHLDGEWSIDVTVRITGNGVSLAGDGLALWYTQAPQAVGDLMGASARFMGVGIFVDTYVNSPDTSHPHPYVSIVVNDGTEVAAHDMAGFHTSMHAPAGCSVDVRQIGQYTPKYTTFRMLYAARTITLWHTSGVGPDAYTFKNEGEWTRCTSVNNIDLPHGYHFGASATTGEVSDNHDIFRFLVRQGGSLTWGHGAPPAAVKAPEFVPAPPVAQQGQQNTGGVPPTPEQLEEVVHRSWLVSNLQTKMEEAERRLNMLREEVEHRVEGMTEHMDGLLQRLRSTDDTLDDRLRSLEEQLSHQLSLMAEEHSSLSRAWILPFVGLCAAIIVLAGWGYKQYTQISKLHKF